MGTLYRYEIRYKSEDGDTEIELLEYPVIRETVYTYFIKNGIFGGIKQVRKRYTPNAYAHDTKKAAKEHFIRRTHKRITWYNFWKEECEKGLELIKEVK